MKHLWKMDLLRGMAILGVFLYHVQQYFYPGMEIPHFKPNGLLDATSLKTFFINFSPMGFGWMGVPLFIMISGFLIHLIYLSENKPFDAKKFYSKRFWRIYPPYLLVLFFFFFLQYHSRVYLSTRLGKVDLLSHIFLVHNLFNKTILTGGNGAFWSLALEAQLYLIYPLFLWLRSKLKIKKAFLIIFGLNILTLGTGVLINHNIISNTAFILSLPVYWFVWCAGAVLAENYFNNEMLFSAKRYPVIIICSLFIAVACKYSIYSIGIIFYAASFFFYVFMEWFLTSRHLNESNPFCRLLVVIGICSYSIYLIHSPILWYTLSFFTSHVPFYHFSSLFSVLLEAAIIFFISYSMYQFIEKPSIAYGKKLKERRNEKTAIESIN